MSKDFKNKFFEKAKNKAIKWAQPTMFNTKPQTDASVRDAFVIYEQAFNELFPLINEMREALESFAPQCRNTGMAIDFENCTCAPCKRNKALKNLYEFVGGGE